VFWRISFPLLIPWILSAALLSFALSFDDFIITYFNSGSMQTFPTFIYISASRGVPAEANVIASTVFILTLAVVVTSQLITRARSKALKN
jgi:spermidine/putrescine transport system permease protein